MASTSYAFLRKVPFFAELSEEDLDHLCQMVTEVFLPEGKDLFAEGDPGDQVYVVKSGQVEILKASGSRMVLLDVRGAGDVIGEMALLEAVPRSATVRARTDCHFIAIGSEQFQQLIETKPGMALTMLHTVSARLRSTSQMLQGSEKLAQIGTLTAGIAHELNNPAAAARRGAEQLQETLVELQRRQMGLSQLQLPDLGLLSEMEKMAHERAGRPEILDSLARSDRQEALEDWLDGEGIDQAWELAPVLVDLGLQTPDLEKWKDAFGEEALPVVLGWLAAVYTAHSLLFEISQGAARIGEIVKALKSYVYLDQAPLQEVDVHEGLENTLVILRSKLKKGINVHRRYDPNLPRIQAFGSELNQVWTNLIDNAIDAMNGQGELWIRTQADEAREWVSVEIEDNGPGIPLEDQSKIFSPFFTTKAVGEGTGLGLNTSDKIIRKHGGEIKFFSQPGKTCFHIRLPVNFEAARSGETPLVANPTPDDAALQRILETTATIAVVGISNKPGVPARTVPEYLHRHGYKILPVNPEIESILGEKAYPDLDALPGPVDVVLVFRRNEFVPEIVEKAIHNGARVVWMQEGIYNDQAAEAARNAGMQVVMNTCMRSTHRRLLGEGTVKPGSSPVEG